jgi:hypothetical protein
MVLSCFANIRHENEAIERVMFKEKLIDLSKSLILSSSLDNLDIICVASYPP